jgi:hypothetical protein
LIVVCIVVAAAIAVVYVVVVVAIVVEVPLIFQTNEKVNLPICSEQTKRTRIGNDGRSRPESVDRALERHGRRERLLRRQRNDGSDGDCVMAPPPAMTAR